MVPPECLGSKQVGMINAMIPTMAPRGRLSSRFKGEPLPRPPLPTSNDDKVKADAAERAEADDDGNDDKDDHNGRDGRFRRLRKSVAKVVEAWVRLVEGGAWFTRCWIRLRPRSSVGAVATASERDGPLE